MNQISLLDLHSHSIVTKITSRHLKFTATECPPNRIEKLEVKGTGLGLSIVKRIVDIHKGKVWVEDNPEGENIFLVKIPVISDGKYQSQCYFNSTILYISATMYMIHAHGYKMRNG